jgi:RodZ C-terminal domain
MVSWWQGRRNDEMDKVISLESLITDDSPAPESDRVQPGTKKVAAVEKRKVSGGSNAQIGDKISAVEVLGRHRRSPLEEIPPRRRIEIMPVQEAWIEITDAAQRSLFYGLAKPGQAVSLSGFNPSSWSWEMPLRWTCAIMVSALK